jgi:hypothetical protein
VWVGWWGYIERETPSQSSFDPFLAETRQEYESVRGWLTSWRCNVLAVLRTVGLGQRWCADGTIEGRRSRGSNCITVLPDETSKKEQVDMTGRKGRCRHEGLRVSEIQEMGKVGGWLEGRSHTDSSARQIVIYKGEG